MTPLYTGPGVLRRVTLCIPHHVGITLRCGNPMFYDVVVCYLVSSTLASIVVGNTVYKLLYREFFEFPFGLNNICPLHGPDGGKGPAWVTMTLVLDISHRPFLSPVETVRQRSVEYRADWVTLAPFHWSQWDWPTFSFGLGRKPFIAFLAIWSASVLAFASGT